MSTPNGKRGFFWEAWANGGAEWTKVKAPATECARISKKFLEDEKKMSAEANANAALLLQFEADRPRTMQACKLLGDHGVIEPWVLQLQHNDEVIIVEGLYRINESKLMEVAPEILVALRDCGGLMLCYAQLMSMQHMLQLGTVSQRTHWATKAAELAGKVAPLDITDDNGILSFAKI